MKILETLDNFQKKKCNRCNLDKDISEFYKKGDSTRPECKSCTNKVNKEYKKNNRDFVNQLKRKYHQSENGKKVDKKYSDNYKKNMPTSVKDKLRQTHKTWCNYQYNNNSKYKLIVSIRNLIGKSFRGSKKPMKTESILGCTIGEFRIHIEKQFTEGMCWENHGKWHLDHIVPISWAKGEAEILEFNHYTNFKPMWGIDNIKKGNRFSEK